MKLALIGGGSGNHDVLTGLKQYSELTHQLKQEDISVIVSEFDNGGNTGAFMEERNPKNAEGHYLPLGDNRQCLAALANNKAVGELFQKRITKGKNKGDVAGNSFLDAAYELSDGDFEKAIDIAREALDVRGHVLPCTLEHATFFGELENGEIIEGEHQVVQEAIYCMSPIKNTYLEPMLIPANPRAVRAIEAADRIILSPGSLHTSLCPPLKVQGIKEAIQNSKAPVLYVMNIVTQRGETDNYTAQDHLDVIEKTLERKIDFVFVNNGCIPKDLLEAYAKKHQFPVENNLGLRKGVISRAMIAKGEIIRHDPLKLATLLLSEPIEIRR